MIDFISSVIKYAFLLFVGGASVYMAWAAYQEIVAAIREKLQDMNRLKG